MKAVQIYLWLHIILTASVLVNTFDPITTTVVGAIANLWQKIYDSPESCDSKWISFNAAGECEACKCQDSCTVFI